MTEERKADFDDDPQLKREWPVQLGREIIFDGHGLIEIIEKDGRLRIVLRYRGEVYRREKLRVDFDPPPVA